jgi:predicted RNA-binding protein with TRAM domain
MRFAVENKMSSPRAFGSSPLRMLAIWFALVMVSAGSASAQTIFDWLDTAPDNNWKQGAGGARWNPGGLWDEPGFGVLRFYNNHQLNMNNNVAGTYSMHGLILGGTSGVRTISGNTLRLFDSGGTDPYIANDSSITHVLNLPIEGDGTSTDPLIIRINNSGGLTFSNTINNQGSALNVEGSTANAATVTFNGVISGTGGLFKNNVNTTVVLAANNSFSGQVTHEGGTISITNNNSLGTGRMRLGNAAVSTRFLVNSNTTRSTVTALNSGATNVVIEVPSNVTFTQSGALEHDNGTANTTKFAKAGPGTLVLSGTGSTYNGQMQIGEGTVIIGQSGSFATNRSTSARAIDLGLNISDVSQGNSVTLLASNNVTISNSVYVAPNTSSAARTIGISGNGTNTFNDEFFMDGTLTVNAGSSATDQVNFSGNLINGPGGLIKTNAGILALSGANTFTNGVNLAQGTLLINSTTALGAATSRFTISGTSTINNTTAGALTLANNNPQTWNADFTFTGTRNLNMGTGAVTLGTNRVVTVSSNQLTVGGVVSGAFSLTKAGAGTLVLSGSSSYGATTLRAGTLVWSNNNALGTTGTVTINDAGTPAGANPTLLRPNAAGGTLSRSIVIANLGSGNAATIAKSNADEIVNYSGTQTYNKAVRLENTGTGTVGPSRLRISGAISGAGSINIVGGGPVRFEGANTLSGAVTVEAGTLELINASTLGTSPSLTLFSGAGFNVSGRTNAVTMASGQKIVANATGADTTATITVGTTPTLTLAANAGIQFAARGSGATAPLTVAGAGGSLALNGAPIEVITSTALAAGTYKLIAKSGSATVTGTPGTLTVNGSQLAAGQSARLAVTSGELVMTVAAAPGAPTIGTITPGNTTLSVAFTPGSDGGSAITDYKWSIDGTNYTTRAGTATPILITGLTNGTAYTVRIRAVNAFGDGTVATAASTATPVTTPAAPTIGSITAGDKQLSVNFTAGSDGGSAIITYKYSTDGGSSFRTRSSGTTASPLVITNLSSDGTTPLTNGVSYNVQIRATNAVGDGTPTATVAATPVSSATVPAAPTITDITPGNGQLSIAFTPGSDGGEAITNYQWSLDGTSYTSAGQTTSPIVITGLTNGTSYTVRLRAVNVIGNSSAATGSPATPRTIPGAPTIGTITPGNGQLSVAFTVPTSDGGSAITNYKWSTDGSTYTAFSPATTNSPLVITGLTNGTAYTVRIRAVNAAGDGTVATAGETSTPRTVPGAPTGLTVTPGSTQLTASFTAPSDNGGSAITNYEYSSNGGSSFTAVSPPSTSTNITITGLTNGTAYSVQVRAVNIAGSGAATESVSGTPRTTPDAPTLGAITPGNGQLSVAFTAPASDGGSAITDYKWSIDGTNYTLRSGTASPIDITGLTNGTAYTVRIRAVNAAGDGTVATAGATATPRTTPSITTGTATNLNSYAATLAGEVTATGGAAITERGFYYSTTNGFADGAGTKVSTAGTFGTGAFSNTVTGLSKNTAYYFKAFAVNSAGTNYGSQVTFTTLNAPDGRNPINSTNATNAFLGDTIALNIRAWQTWNSVNRGYATVFGRFSNTDLTAGTSEGAGRDPGSADGDFYANTPKLTQTGTFYWAMRVSYGSGADYYFDRSMADWAPLAATLPSSASLSIEVSPLNNPAVSSSVASASQINLTHTRTNGKSVMIVRKQDSAVTWSPTNGIAYTDGQNVGDGHTVVKGSLFADSFNDTGLSGGTTYHYKIYSENYSYYSDGVTTSATTTGSPAITIAGATSATATAFSTTYGTPSEAQQFAVAGSNLTGDITATAPSGFQVSNNGSSWGGTATFTRIGTTASGTLHVRLAGTAGASTTAYNSVNITVASDGATTRNLTTAASGNTVAKKNLDITVASQTITYGFPVSGPFGGVLNGAAVNGYTVDPTDLVNGDTSAVVTGTPTYTTTYEQGDEAGTSGRTITISTGLTAANYTPNPIAGTVTVEALNNPSAVAASSSTTNSVSLTHTRTNSIHVLIARKAGSAVTFTPVPGTAYTNNQVVDGHTIVKGSSGSDSTVDEGLQANTTYHYKVYSEYYGYYSAGVATNATTLGPTITIAGGTSATATAFTTTYGTASAAQEFAIAGTNLTASITATAPTGFQVSSNGTDWGSTATLTQSSGSASGTLQVRLAATATVGGSYDGQVIALTSTGATTRNLTTAATGNSVAQKTLMVTGLTGANKVYDRTTAATATGTAALSGVESGDTVTLEGTPTFTFVSANVGTGISITTTGYTLGGAQAGNYSLTQPTLTANITVKGLTVTGLTGVNKVYNRTTSATATGTAALSGVESGDLVSLEGTPTFTFASANVGTGISITTTDYTLGGAQADNYFLTQPTLSANITAKGLTITGVTAANKVYDGNTTATLNTGSAALTGVESGDTVTLSSGSATGAFDSKTVANGKTVTTSGFALSGTDNGNYSLTQPTTTANITALGLTVTGASVTSKVYDGTTTATVTGATLSGVVSGDTVNLTGGTSGTFASADVGTGISVTTSMGISGTDSGNYSISQPTLTGNITQATQTITFNALANVNAGTTNGLTATASSGLTISYTSSNTNVASISGTNAIANAAGVTTITASQAGNSNYSAATPVSQTLNVAAAVGSVSGILAGWNSTGLSTTSTWAPATNNATTTNSNLAITTQLTRGSSITASGSGLADAIGGNGGWSTNASDSTAWVFAFQANTGYSVSVTNITGFTRKSSSGPSNVLVDVSVNGGAYTNVGTISTTSTSGTGSSYSIALTNVASLQNVSSGQIIRFRINPLGTTGNWYMLNGSNALVVNGTVFQAPTPTITPSGTFPALTTTYGTASSNNSVTVTGGSLTTNITATAPTGFELSTNGSTWSTNPANFAQSNGFANGTLYLRLAANASAGSYNSQTVTLSSSGATNTSIAIGNSTVNRYPVTVGAVAKTKVYGEADPALTYTNDPLLFSDTFTGSITRAIGTNAGTYAITQGTLTNANYDITFLTNSFTISTKALTITANPVTKALGLQLTTPQTGSTNFTSSGLISGESISSVTITYTAGAGSAAESGVYTNAVVPSAPLGINTNNYEITFVAANLTVDNAPSINVDPLSLAAFSTTYGTDSSTQSFTVTAASLGGSTLTLEAPSGFQVSTNASSGFGSNVALNVVSGAVASTTIYARIPATASASTNLSGNISISDGTTTQSVSIAASTVSAKALTIGGLSATNRIYDATTNGTVSGTPVYVGLTNSQSFDVTNTVTWSFATKDVGTNRLMTASASFTAPSENYTVTQPTFAADITQATLSLSNAAATSRAYAAGNTNVTITGTLAGVLESDTVGFTGTGTIASANVGTNIAVTANVALTGADAGNYTLTQPTGLTVDITKATNTITFGALANVTVGTTNALTATASSGLSVSYTSSNTNVATISGSNVIAVAAGVTTITASQAGDANYEAAAPAAQTLNVAGAMGAVAAIGIHDFETSNAAPVLSRSTATLSGSPGVSATSSGTSGTGDSPASSPLYSGGSQGYRVAGPASGTTAAVVAHTFGSLDTRNYSSISVSVRVAAMSIGSNGNGMETSDYCEIAVSPDDGITWYQQLRVTGGASGNSRWAFSGTGVSARAYQANNTFTTSTASAGGVLTGNGAVTTLTVSDLPAVSSLRIRVTTSCNASAESWVVDDVVVSGSAPTATITPSGSFAAVSTTYGTASEASASTVGVTGGSLTTNITATAPSGFEVSSNGSTWGSTATFTQTSGFADGTLYLRLGANAGAGTYSSQVVALTSGSASNSVAIASSTVSQKALTVTSAAVTSKTYDGNTTATITGTLSGVVGADAVTLNGTGTFASANVGTGIAVTSTSTLGGAAAGNYSLTQPTDLSGDITQKALTISGASATARAYNGATAVAVSGGSLVGVISGDTVTLGGSPTGTMATPDVGTAKAVTVSGYSISGASSSNYSLTQPTGLTADITAKALTITAPTIASKVYDGTATAGAVTVGTLSGFVGSETVTATATAANYSSANVGTYSGVVVTYTLANGTNGGLASNYSLAAGSATGVITAASLASNQITLTPGAGNAYTASGPSGSTFDITYSGRTTNGVTTIHTNAATAPTAAGYYTVTATATGNYTGSSSTNYFVAGLVAAADSLQSPTAVMNILHGALLGNDRRIDSSGDASTNGLSITAVANGTGSATLGNPFIAFNSGGPGPRTFTYTLSHSGQTAIGTVTVTAMNLQANAPSLSITNLPIVAFYDAGVNETTATVTLVGDPGKMYYVQYCGEMGQSWQDAGGWESGTGTFQVTILQEGNHETDWENSMFFKAQVTNP